MSRSVIILAMSCGTLWWAAAAPAIAQGYGPYNGPGYTYTPPAVSPYLNLGYNQNGLSNYQTLVKPMIDEQESMQRQAANLQKLQRQVRDAQSRQAPAEPAGPAGRTKAVRFMHYSHYFKSPQQNNRLGGGGQGLPPFAAGP